MQSARIQGFELRRFRSDCGPLWRVWRRKRKAMRKGARHQVLKPTLMPRPNSYFGTKRQKCHCKLTTKWGSETLSDGGTDRLLADHSWFLLGLTPGNSVWEIEDGFPKLRTILDHGAPPTDRSSWVAIRALKAIEIPESAVGCLRTRISELTADTPAVCHRTIAKCWPLDRI